MITLLALVAAAQVSSVSASRDDSILTVRVEADSAIDAGKVGAKLESRRLLLEVPASLDKESRTFHVSHRYLQAKRAGEGVEVEIPIGAKVNCALPVTVSAVTNGIEAKLKCEDEKEAAVAPAAVVVEAAKTADAPGPAKAAAPKSEVAKSNVATSDVAKADLARAEAAKEAPKSAPAVVVAETTAPAPAPTAAAAPAAAAEKLELNDAKPESRSSPFGAIAIVVIFAGLAGAALFARKKKQSARTIQVLETAALGPKRSLVLAKVGGRTLLLSSSEAGVTLLQNVDDLPAQETLQPATQDVFARLDKHLADPDVVPAPKLDVLSKLRKFAAPSRKPAQHPSFDALFAETQEDQELRMKLLAGHSTRAQ